MFSNNAQSYLLPTWRLHPVSSIRSRSSFLLSIWICIKNTGGYRSIGDDDNNNSKDLCDQKWSANSTATSRPPFLRLSFPLTSEPNRSIRRFRFSFIYFCVQFRVLEAKPMNNQLENWSPCDRLTCHVSCFFYGNLLIYNEVRIELNMCTRSCCAGWGITSSRRGICVALFAVCVHRTGNAYTPTK